MSTRSRGGDGNSGSLWLDLLGLGPIAQTLHDPEFARTVQNFVAMFQDLYARQVRIEAKLDALLGDTTHGATGHGAGDTGLSDADRPAGIAAPAVAGRASDDGSGEPARTAPALVNDRLPRVRDE